MYENYVRLLNEYDAKTADVSKATGISSTVFSEWKKGKCAPKLDKLQLIADYFGVSLEQLTNGNDMMCDLNFQMPVARNISKLREEKEMSPEELAEELNIHPYALAKIESGSLVPNSRLIDKMADIFNMPVSEFWEKDEIYIPQCNVATREKFLERTEFMESLEILSEEETENYIVAKFMKLKYKEKLEWYKGYLNQQILACEMK